MGNINLYESNIETLVKKREYYKSREKEWSDDEKFMSVDSYIVNQVDLYWPLIGEGIRPKIISRDASLCLIKKIIDERRVFDAYFNTINSTGLSLARIVYKIMNDSIKNSIPVDAISQRISRFKRGKKTNQTYIDLDNLIREYRAILRKNNIYDMPMIRKKYWDLAEVNSYPNNLKEIARRVKNMYFTEFNILHKSDKLDIRNEKVPPIVFDEDYSSYCDMKNGLENLIYKMCVEDKINPSDILILVPRLDEDIKNLIEKINSHDKAKNLVGAITKNINFISQSQAEVCLSALAIYKDCEYLLSDEEKVELLSAAYRDNNYIKIKTNMESILRSFRENIRNNTTPIIDLNSIDDGDNASEIDISKIEDSISDMNFIYKPSMSEAEFIKKFYKENLVHDDESIAIISKMANLIDELGDLVDIETKLSYIRSAISYNSSSKIKLENMALNSVLVLEKEDLKSIKTNRNRLIIFDIHSKKYDPVIEDQLSTKIAYMEDSVLQNLDKENIGMFYRDLVDLEIDKYLLGIFDGFEYIYLMGSDLGINGYEQENRFGVKVRCL